MSEHLDVTGTRDLRPQQVRELVDRQRPPEALRRGNLQWDVVVPVGDGHVLDDVYCMQDVTASRRHIHADHTLRRQVLSGTQLHAVAELADVCRRDVHAHNAHDVLDGGVAGALGEQRGLVHDASFLVNNLHRLGSEGRSTVLSEHGHHGVQHNVGLGEVRASALDEHVLGVHLYPRVLAVDDGRHGEHCALAVVDDWVHWRVIDDVCVGLEVLR